LWVLRTRPRPSWSAPTARNVWDDLPHPPKKRQAWARLRPEKTRMACGENRGDLAQVAKCGGRASARTGKRAAMRQRLGCAARDGDCA
jgi:hypothetical protein